MNDPYWVTRQVRCLWDRAQLHALDGETMKTGVFLMALLFTHPLLFTFRYFFWDFSCIALWYFFYLASDILYRGVSFVCASVLIIAYLIAKRLTFKLECGFIYLSVLKTPLRATVNKGFPACSLAYFKRKIN